jgi:hypothetical protein
LKRCHFLPAWLSRLMAVKYGMGFLESGPGRPANLADWLTASSLSRRLAGLAQALA